MKLYKYFIFCILFFVVACQAENKKLATEHSIIDNPAINASVVSFSNLVATHNVKEFIALTKLSGIYVVRQFTSGNLGGRGAEFGASLNPSSINEKLELPIENQTALSLGVVFPGLPIQSIKTLPTYALSAEIEQLPFERWEAILKRDLMGKVEMESGDPMILQTASLRYWVYAEAQIIDSILVGGFAVFATENEKTSLVAIIEFL